MPFYKCKSHACGYLLIDAELSDGFCRQCGTPIGKTTIQQAQEVRGTERDSREMAPRPRAARKRLPMLGGFVAACLLGMGVLCTLLLYEDQSNSNSKQGSRSIQAAKEREASPIIHKPSESPSGLNSGAFTDSGSPSTQGKISEVPIGFTSLFNGKDLTGWKIHPQGVGQWRVEDGVLVGSGPESYLFSERGNYRDFHFFVECTINDKGTGGQFFRSEFSRGIPRGYGAAVNATHWDPVKTGSIYPDGREEDMRDLKRIVTRDEAPHKANEWFTHEVICLASKITVLVNGKQSVEWVDPKHRFETGHFVLQQCRQGSVVKYRKIWVRELPTAERESSGGAERLTAGSVWKGKLTYSEGADAGITTDYELHVEERDGLSFKGHKFDNGAGRNRADVDGEVAGNSIKWRESSARDPMVKLAMCGTLVGDTIKLTFQGEHGRGRTNKGKGRLALAPERVQQIPPPDRKARIVSGDWKAENNMLAQADADMGNCRIFFGDPKWTDYDFSFGAVKSSGKFGASALFRAKDSANYMRFDLAGWQNRKYTVECFVNGQHNWVALDRGGEMSKDQKYRVFVKIRGNRFQCYIDDEEIYDCTDDRLDRGAVGICSWGAAIQVDSIKVASPDGKILWEGSPELGGTGKKTFVGPK